jgi:hypothetical protein
VRYLDIGNRFHKIMMSFICSNKIKKSFSFCDFDRYVRRKESALRASQSCKTARRAVHCGHLLQQEEQHGNDAGGGETRGVSKATVSRVLSGNGYVSQETKDRVFQAVAESGYRICWRATWRPKSQTLGLVVTNTLYHGVYFSELLFHVARMTEDKGRQLILADGKHSAEEEREAIQYLLDLRCDAIIIYPRFLSVDEMDEIVENQAQPIMVLNRRLRATPATASGPIKKPRRLRRSKS